MKTTQQQKPQVINRWRRMRENSRKNFREDMEVSPIQNDRMTFQDVETLLNIKMRYFR